MSALNLTLYIDFDDVLCETARSFVTLLERHFQKTVAFEDIVSFDLRVSFGLSDQEYDHFMRLGHMTKVLAAFQPMPGAVDGLRQLNAMGYEIAIITGRPPSAAEVSKAWLDVHRVPYHQLVFVDKYGRGGFHVANPDVITLDQLTQRNFDFAVEDSGDMALFLASEMGLPVALLDRPWNRDIRTAESEVLALIERCTDWKQVLDWARLNGRGV